MSDDAVSPAPEDVEVNPTPLLALRQLGAARAEDGRGGQVSSARAIAFDVDADRFPPRALDPILFVGELAFHHYEYPEPGVLRFVTDGSALPQGALVAIGYDAQSEEGRVILHSALDLSGAR